MIQSAVAGERRREISDWRKVDGSSLLSLVEMKRSVGANKVRHAPKADAKDFSVRSNSMTPKTLVLWIEISTSSPFQRIPFAFA
jgi:hypothetical protein